LLVKDPLTTVQPTAALAGSERREATVAKKSKKDKKKDKKKKGKK
jgi:hypothetical protein